MTHQTGHSPTEVQTSFDNTSKLAVFLIGAIAVLAGIVMGVNNPVLRNAASVQGLEIDTLFSVLLGIATTTFVIVQGFFALFHRALCALLG